MLTCLRHQRNLRAIYSVAIIFYLASFGSGLVELELGGALLAQTVSINTSGASGDASAMLDVNATNKGLLIPRISLTSAIDVTTINSPVTSLMIYNTSTAGVPPNDVVPGFYFWDGSKWYSLTGSSGGGVVAFSDFYALMPGDNPATVAPGTAVKFPQNGPTNGFIIRMSDNEFILPDIGTYQIDWQISTDEAGQLGLMLDGLLLSSTIVGRATGTSQIVGSRLITTTNVNTLLSVVNPPGNPVALTITPFAGGTYPVSASLVIKRIQ